MNTCSDGFSLVQRLTVGLAFLFCIDDTIAEPFDNAIFVQNHLRQCSGEMSCFGGDPTIEVDSDSDLGTNGSAASQIFGPTLGTQSAISAGYSGSAYAPSISALGLMVSLASEFWSISLGSIIIRNQISISETGRWSAETLAVASQ